MQRGRLIQANNFLFILTDYVKHKVFVNATQQADKLPQLLPKLKQLKIALAYKKQSSCKSFVRVILITSDTVSKVIQVKAKDAGNIFRRNRCFSGVYIYT